jgi:hypothetical protein
MRQSRETQGLQVAERRCGMSLKVLRVGPVEGPGNLSGWTTERTIDNAIQPSRIRDKLLDQGCDGAILPEVSRQRHELSCRNTPTQLRQRAID